MIANVVKEWESAKSNGRADSFCWENYLSNATMEMLVKLKKDLAGHLLKLKFISSMDVKASNASNKYSKNENLVRAIICSGLYPRVALVKKIIKRDQGGAILQTRTDKRASIHPKSVNSRERHFKHPWLVYHQKMKSTAVNIFDCSEVSPMALLFFGEDLQVGHDVLPDGKIVETISVDSFVTFNCSRDTSKMFKILRRGLLELLEFKAENPGPTKWSQKELEGATLQTIIDLFSCEPKGTSHVIDEDSDDDY
jgi:ATP-dependent RNA helicase DHX36